MNETKHAKNIGILLKNLPQKHSREYSQGLTLDENTIIQKLISEDVLTAKVKMEHADGKNRTHTGVRVDSKDYLKALIVLDYYSTVLDESNSICENLITLAVNLRELKDSSDKVIYDLNLETVIVETGLASQQRSSESPDSSKPENITRRYNENNAFIGNDPLRKIEPYYQAIGRRIVEMVTPARRKYLESVNSRSDLGAIIFSDSVISVLNDKGAIDLIEKDLSKSKIQASITALYVIRNEASLERIKNAIVRSYK